MPPNPDSYNKIVDASEIGDIRAIAFSAEMEKGDELARSSISVDLKDRPRWNLSEARDALHTEVDFDLKISSKDVSDAVFRAKITYSIGYTFSEPLPETPEIDEALEMFARENPRFNAWPFLREYVNYASSYMAMPPIVLPLLKPYARMRKPMNVVTEDARAEVAETATNIG